ncbi:MAG: SPFH domain-containing protein, partial [Clostridia bacterium]|nr:SPFH domain-containing protein [Clostridia bacterium]
MKEIVLNSRKNGMGMLLLLILLHVLALLGLFVGIAKGVTVLIILSILILAFGWILFCGLKVL